MEFSGNVDNEPTRSRFTGVPDLEGLWSLISHRSVAFDLPQIKGPGRSRGWLVHVLLSSPLLQPLLHLFVLSASPLSRFSLWAESRVKGREQA